SDEAGSEPFSLPQLQLPLELRIGRIEVGRVRLNAVEQAQTLQLRADWRRDGLNIRALQLRREDLTLDLAGRLRPEGDWPLELRGDAAIHLPELPAWALKIAVDGELREHLVLAVQSRGYLNGALSGRVRPLETD